jgi:MmyB-like transcription regulator ligand binding domain
VATFGTPLDVTVAELVIESFFPADPETGAVLRALAGV